MKGGGISTCTNGLLTEGSSAALRASIRHAAVAGQLPRFNHGQLPGKLQSVPFKGKLFPLLIRIYPLALCGRPCLAEFGAACNHLETLYLRERRLPRGRLSSPGAAEAGQARVGRLLDQRRDDALHHVRQHGEGGHHDEVYEAWRHGYGRNFISMCNE